jgi:hypothetical protein
MRSQGLRKLKSILKTGSLVFGASAIFLIVAPGVFLDLLKLDRSSALSWSMRMIGITLLALAGNMWNNAAQRQDSRVVNVAKIMCVSAAALGILTLMIPAQLSWFTYLYSAIGFGFSGAYLLALLGK